MEQEAESAVELYQYPAGPESETSLWTDLVEMHQGGTEEPAQAPVPVENATHDAEQIQRDLEAKLQRQFEAGRVRGIEEGRAEERGSGSSARAAEEVRHREQILALTRSIAEQRERYFGEAEQAVVELALAIAARILRREAEMDPLFLQGAVRVALGQLAQATTVRLRVPAVDCSLWTEAMTHIPNLPLRPEVVADQAMKTGDCRIESEFGSADLGLAAQLREIERGLLGRREVDGPRSRSFAGAATDAPGGGAR